MSRPSSQWEEHFLRENQELINQLANPSEKERLWALVQLESIILGRGFSDVIFDKVLNIALKDSSALVRAQAQRFLYHEPSECWPIDDNHQRQLYEALFRDPVGRGMGGYDGLIRFEMQELEERINWFG